MRSLQHRPRDLRETTAAVRRAFANGHSVDLPSNSVQCEAGRRGADQEPANTVSLHERVQEPILRETACYGQTRCLCQRSRGGLLSGSDQLRRKSIGDCMPLHFAKSHSVDLTSNFSVNQDEEEGIESLQTRFRFHERVEERKLQETSHSRTPQGTDPRKVLGVSRPGPPKLPRTLKQQTFSNQPHSC